MGKKHKEVVIPSLTLVERMEAFIDTQKPRSFKEAVKFFSNEKPKSVKRTYFTVISRMKASKVAEENKYNEYRVAELKNNARIAILMGLAVGIVVVGASIISKYL